MRGGGPASSRAAASASSLGPKTGCVGGTVVGPAAKQLAGGEGGCGDGSKGSLLQEGRLSGAKTAVIGRDTPTTPTAIESAIGIGYGPLKEHPNAAVVGAPPGPQMSIKGPPAAGYPATARAATSVSSRPVRSSAYAATAARPVGRSCNVSQASLPSYVIATPLMETIAAN